MSANSKVNGNIFFVSDYLEISDGSMVSSNNSGCSFNQGQGSPNLFISQSFKCGLVGGSHGGNGGAGRYFDKKDRDSCLLNSYSRISSNPFSLPTQNLLQGATFLGSEIPSLLAMSSGSTGSAFKSKSQSASPVAPGVITIISKVINIQRS